MTYRLAVIGNPVEHSLSPKIHSQFAEEFAMKIKYEKIFCEAIDFEKAVREFFEQGGTGLNITIPFKEKAFSLVDHIEDGYAHMACAVNTIMVRNTKLFGYNTDGHGLVDDLLDRCRITLKKKKIAVLGAGGASAGILPALLSAQVSKVYLWNRTNERADKLASRFIGKVETVRLEEIITCDLVINALAYTTPLDFIKPYLIPGCDYYDMSYNQDLSPTEFCKMASYTGAKNVFSGQGMLIRQAAHSFSIWFHEYPKIESVRL